MSVEQTGPEVSVLAENTKKPSSPLKLVLLSTWVSLQRLFCMFGHALTVSH